MHVLVPEQTPPDHPANVDPESGVAVTVTWLPEANFAEHVEPHEIPAGELVIVPDPDPLLVTVSV